MPARTAVLASLALAVALLAGCETPPDSPMRAGPDGPRILLAPPRSCLDGACLNVVPSTGNVWYRDNVTVGVPRRLRDADGYVSVRDFQRLLRAAREAPPFSSLRAGTAVFF